MEENICKGCIYDITAMTEIDVEKFNSVLDNCLACKRAVFEELQDDYLDMYKPMEE